MATDTLRTAKRRRLDLNNDSSTQLEAGETLTISPKPPSQGYLIGSGSETESEVEDDSNISMSSARLRSLDCVITPPDNGMSRVDVSASVGVKEYSDSPIQHEVSPELKIISSPIKLTHIKDLSPTKNVDTVSLSDLLGDPLIKECWQFNYLFDVDFIMRHLDEDTRGLVQVRIIHGLWKKEDINRLALEEAAQRYENVQLITAYMPEPFGTHHSKMMILIRQDDHAQVVIHTANMISQDWRNMCQAVWRSPLLPLDPTKTMKNQSHPIGSGARFQMDLLQYLKAYGKKLTDLSDQLVKYDFSHIRAAFIASTPCRQDPKAIIPSTTSWGWPGLKQVLQHVPKSASQDGTPNVNVQVSSVATLDRTGDWLQNFFSVLSGSKVEFRSKEVPPSLALDKTTRREKPKFHVIFPVADTIRRSLDGYASGGSIHWKLQSAAQQAQLAYFKPYLCHWAPDSSSSPGSSVGTKVVSKASADNPYDPGPGQLMFREAGRRRAAPHIKTYIRFSDSSQTNIDWAMLTSANLSTQAWGSLPGKKDGKVRISSWETGVVVWPDLLGLERAIKEERQKVSMVPTFGQDVPRHEQVDMMTKEGAAIIVGLRMPYDLPLVPYADEDEPWCATAEHELPDWKGIF